MSRHAKQSCACTGVRGIDSGKPRTSPDIAFMCLSGQTAHARTFIDICVCSWNGSPKLVDFFMRKSHGLGFVFLFIGEDVSHNFEKLFSLFYLLEQKILVKINFLFLGRKFVTPFQMQLTLESFTFEYG